MIHQNHPPQPRFSYDIPAIDKRKAEIERRINNLQERIAASKQQVNRFTATPGTNPSSAYDRYPRQTSGAYAQRFEKPEAPPRAHEKYEGPRVYESSRPEPYNAALYRPEPAKPVGNFPVTPHTPEDFSKLYELVKTTLEGQAVLQSELLNLRKQMKDIIIDKKQEPAFVPHENKQPAYSQLESPYQQLGHRNSMVHRSNSASSPADKLWSNDRRYAKYVDENKPITSIFNTNQIKQSTIIQERAPLTNVAAPDPNLYANYTSEMPKTEKANTHNDPYDKYKMQSVLYSSAAKNSQNAQQKIQSINTNKADMNAPPKFAPSSTPQFQNVLAEQLRQRRNSAKGTGTVIVNTREPVKLADTSFERAPAKASVQKRQSIYGRTKSKQPRQDLNITVQEGDNNVKIRTSLRNVMASKITRKLRESEEAYRDAEHKNNKHEHHHFLNTTDLQKKLREDLLRRVYQMRDTKRYK